MENGAPNNVVSRKILLASTRDESFDRRGRFEDILKELNITPHKAGVSY